MDMLDDNEIALDETTELVNALSGAHDVMDDDLEKMLASDLQKYGNIEPEPSAPTSLGLPTPPSTTPSTTPKPKRAVEIAIPELH